MKRAAILAGLWVALVPMLGEAADLNIAFIGTLTGAVADRAVDQEAGLQLGIKDLGGRLGGVEFSYARYDDHRNADEAKRIFGSLTQSGHLHVLLLSSAAAQTAEALVPLAVASGTLIINLGDVGGEQAGHACNANFFSLVALPETLLQMDGQYLQSQGFHTLAVVEPESLSVGEKVAALTRNFHGKIVEIATHRGHMDFSAELAQIKLSHADAIYVLHTGGMAVEFLTQYAESPLKGQVPVFAPATTFDQTTLAASAPAALDAFTVGPWADDLENPANHRLATAFEQEYGRPPSSQAAAGFDAALLLDAAVRALDKKVGDVDQFRAALRRVDYGGTRGTIKFDTNQFPIQTYYLRQVVADARQRLVTSQKGVFARDVRDGHAADCPMRWVAELPPGQKKK